MCVCLLFTTNGYTLEWDNQENFEDNIKYYETV